MGRRYNSENQNQSSSVMAGQVESDSEILSKALSLAIAVSKKVNQGKSEDIGCHSLYSDSVLMAEHISYHAEKGKFPKKLFQHRSPNQTDKEAQYIENNYKQHTLPVFMDYLSTISRPFGDGNWAIDFKEDEEAFKSQGFQTYVEVELPKYGSLENFIKGILPAIKTIDAMGFLAVRPENIPYVLNDEGELVIDSKQLYNPTIFYFDSKLVIDYEIGEYYLFMSHEKSVVTGVNGKEITGCIFELYLPNAVYFIIQTGHKAKNKFNIEEFYRHNLGDCQVEQLKGIPTLKGERILWQSPFLFATDLLDLVAMNANFLQALINSSVFPVKVMYGSPCEFMDSDSSIRCQEGMLVIDGKERVCPSCQGVGLKSRVSPLGTLLLNPKTKFNDGEFAGTQDPLKYISPEIHTLEFLDTKTASDEQKARAILHLRNKNSSTKTANDTTATEVFDDAKGMIAFIKPISDQIFHIYEWALNCIGQQRYKEKFNPPAMTYPKTFDFKSSEDYLNDIANATKNNLPPAFIQLILMQYINSYYGDNEKSTAVFKIVMAADRILGLSQDEINMKMAKGTIDKWEDILHSSTLNLVNNAISLDAKFMEKDLKIQVEKIQELAKLKKDELEGKLATDIYDKLISTDGLGGGGPLANSVGGLTGMIEIVKAVASGVYQLDAAVSLVSQRFGISEDEARKQLGSPPIISNPAQAAKVATLT